MPPAVNYGVPTLMQIPDVGYDFLGLRDRDTLLTGSFTGETTLEDCFRFREAQITGVESVPKNGA
ncbi:hypothetical protein BH10PLA2_BH10PLA2_36510 [soil metagenome]